MQLLRVPPYHHEGNGIVERHNRILISRTRYLLFEHEGSWTDHEQRVTKQIEGIVNKSLGKRLEEIV